MAHVTRPILESLEGKLLMSGDLLGATHVAEMRFMGPVNPMPSPISIAKPIVTAPPTTHPAFSQNGFTMTLTTDKSSYTVGSHVTMTFTETNATSSPITVTTGPSADGFNISQNGVLVWKSNSGPTPMFLRQQTVQPGHSITFSATWVASGTGTFTASQQSAPSGPSATFTVS